jgi:cyclase
VVSIDARRTDDGHLVCIRSATQATAREPVSLAREVESRGAGEILLTSIDQDGTMHGYDLGLVEDVAGAVSIPVLASGGAGGYQDMVAAVGRGASAVCAASIFHFTQCTPLEAKLFMHGAGIPVRLGKDAGQAI